MIAKDNQPSLLAEIEYQFRLVAQFELAVGTAQTLELSHGRIEYRHLSVLSVTTEDVDWPAVAQVFRIEREVSQKKSGDHHLEVR